MAKRLIPIIYAHVPITRRKTLCHVFLDNEQAAFSAAHLANCIAWLFDQGHQEAILDHDGKSFALCFAPRAEHATEEDTDQLTMFDAG